VTISRRILFGLAAIVAAGAASFATASTAKAEYGYDRGCGWTRPVYHGPSVHYDRVYHPTRTHWTPQRGWHSPGHYDYVPGHYDYLHNRHVHGNRHYHR
jgi:hypothetical protein